MRLSDLTSETREMVVVYKTSTKDFPVKIEYRTQAVDLAFISEMSGLQGAEKLIYQLEKVIVKWDLQDDEDKEIPVNRKAIEKAGIPVYLLTSILEAVVEDSKILDDESKNV